MHERADLLDAPDLDVAAMVRHGDRRVRQRRTAVARRRSRCRRRRGDRRTAPCCVDGVTRARAGTSPRSIGLRHPRRGLRDRRRGPRRRRGPSTSVRQVNALRADHGGVVFTDRAPARVCATDGDADPGRRSAKPPGLGALRSRPTAPAPAGSSTQARPPRRSSRSATRRPARGRRWTVRHRQATGADGVRPARCSRSTATTSTCATARGMVALDLSSRATRRGSDVRWGRAPRRQVGSACPTSPTPREDGVEACSAATRPRRQVLALDHRRSALLARTAPCWRWAAELRRRRALADPSQRRRTAPDHPVLDALGYAGSSRRLASTTICRGPAHASRVTPRRCDVLTCERRRSACTVGRRAGPPGRRRST